MTTLYIIEVVRWMWLRQPYVQLSFRATRDDLARLDVGVKAAAPPEV